MTTSIPPFPLPSKARLAKATVAALVLAAIVLVGAVLPAEYGIDPTGVGRALGIYRMSAPDAADASVVDSAVVVASSEPADGAALVRNDYVVQGAVPFRSAEMQVALAPGKGAEVKARMLKGQQFTFAWSSDAAPVEFDMHGEETHAAKDVFTSYWQGDQRAAAGTFTAPFDGSHGWYWRNTSAMPLTITVTVSGFYSDLYRP